MKPEDELDDQADLTGEIQRAKDIIAKSDQYAKSYNELLKPAAKTGWEEFLSIFASGLVENAQLERLKQNYYILEQTKMRAREMLKATIGTAASARSTAINLNRYAIGTIAQTEPKLAVVNSQIAHLRKTYAATIAFVMKHASKQRGFPDIELIKPEVIAELNELSLSERSRIHEEWKAFVQAVNEQKKLVNRIKKARVREQQSVGLERLYAHIMQICEEELDDIDQRFEELKLALTSQTIKYTDYATKATNSAELNELRSGIGQLSGFLTNISQIKEPQIIICNSCGNPNRQTAQFCGTCGEAL